MAGSPRKLLLIGVAAVAGYLGWRKVQADQRAEQDLWAEATDPVPPADLR